MKSDTSLMELIESATLPEDGKKEKFSMADYVDAISLQPEDDSSDNSFFDLSDPLESYMTPEDVLDSNLVTQSAISPDVEALEAPYDLYSFPLKQYLSTGAGSPSWMNGLLLGFGIVPSMVGEFIHFPHLLTSCSEYGDISMGIIVRGATCEGCEFDRDGYCDFHQVPIVDADDVYLTLREASKGGISSGDSYGDDSDVVMLSEKLPYVATLIERYGRNYLIGMGNTLFPPLVGLLGRIRSAK